MPKPHFNKVAILGLGLIGGSIGLELKKRKLAGQVVGYNRSAPGRRAALKRRACDTVHAQAETAVQGADLVILATPVRNIPTLAKKIAPHLQAGAIVTDVGSTKQNIVRQLKKLLPREVYWIGGHPIAGTEDSGMTAALLNLFTDRWWILTPQDSRPQAKQALKKLIRLIQAFGAKTKVLTSHEHDETLAAISHLPHMVAYALMETAVKFRQGRALPLAAGGLKDPTRLAASSAEMWAQICVDNPQAILKLMERFEQNFSKLKKLLTKQDEKALQRFFTKQAQARRNL